MKTIEIETILMRHLNFIQNIIVPNVGWGMFLGGRFLHECDLLILTKSGYATEIEIKISKSDLLNDCKKWHGHHHDHIKNFYFAVPEKLKKIALQEISTRAGLYIIIEKDDYDCVEKVKSCISNKNAKKWTEKEMFKLAKLGTMRICGLKQKIIEYDQKR